MSFTFDADDSRSLTVAIQMITATNSLKGVIQPLTEGILSLIDSSVPDIWLPIGICEVFEQAFGLSYDPKTDLYLVNDTIHDRLKNLNPLITFRLANGVDGGSFVDVDLPYAAFDLQARSPIYPTQTNYFPLRRASNESQYTLGRTFLQEAYIIVDYERANFTVASAIFQDPNPQHIVSIHSTNRTADATHPSRSLRKGAIAGISVGVALTAVIIMTGALWLAIRWWKRRKATHQASMSARSSDYPYSQEVDLESEEKKLPEVSGTERFPPTTEELGGRPRSELPGSMAAAEMDTDISDSRSG